MGCLVLYEQEVQSKGMKGLGEGWTQQEILETTDEEVWQKVIVNI